MTDILTKKNINKKLAFVIGICVFIIVYFAVLNSVCRINITDIILFFASQAAFVLLPGMALLISLNPPDSAIKYMSVSYMLGIGIMIAQSFIYSALKLGQFSLIGMCAVSAFSIFIIYKKKAAFFKVFDEFSYKDALPFFVFAGFILILTAAIGISSYNLPDEAHPVSYIYHDLLWNAGNTVSLANGVPVSDIHVSGLSFGYHFFINAFLSPFYNVLNISAYTLFIKMLPSVAAAVVSSGFYILFSSLFKNKAAAAALSLGALFCCTNTVFHLLWYAYATAVSMGISLAAAYYFLKLFKKFDTVKANDPDFIIFLLLIIIATGIKTLLAAVVIGGAGITILVQLIIKRRNIKNMLIMGVIIIAAVAAIYFALVYGTHAYNGMTRAIGSLMWMNASPDYYQRALLNFPDLPLNAIRILTYPIFLIKNYPLFVISAIALIICLIRKKTELYLSVFLFSSIIVGFGAASVIYQPGMSNIFFAEGALPFCVYSLFFIIKDGNLKKVWKIIMTILTAAALIYTISATISTLTHDYKEGLLSRARNGIGSPYETINAGQYDGMIWIKQNTNKDDLIAADHIYYTPNEVLSDARYYYYTAFSERPFYLEGYNYISTHNPDYDEIIARKIDILKLAYQNDEGALRSLYDEGVKYIAATRFINPDFILDEEFGEEVFSNPEITIFELKIPA